MKTKRTFIRFFILIVAILCCTNASAQSNRGMGQRRNTTTRKIDRKQSNSQNSFGTPQKQNNRQNDKIVDVAEVMPSFPGGDEGLKSWLKNNLRYPPSAANNGIQGRVIVQCIIEKDGSVTVEKIARNVDPELDKEALRLIQTMPKWNPGKSNGSAVRTKRMIVIPFNINQ